MSSTHLVSHRDQTTATTTARLPASPTPPPFGKTSPVQAKLTTRHASSGSPRDVFPPLGGDLHRQASPIDAKIRNPRSERGIEVGSGGGGSMESATSLLQSLKEDDDYLVQKKRRSLMFSQSTSAGRSSAESSPVNKRYVKMGILTPESPAEVSTYRSHQFNNGGSYRSTGLDSSVSPSSTPPPPPPQLSGVLIQSTGTDTSSHHQVVGQGTPPIQQKSSSNVDNQEDFLLVHRNLSDHPSSSPYRLEGVSVSSRPFLQEVRPGMDDGGGDGIKEEGYEVIDLKDVSTVVDSANREYVMVPLQNVQPSPPISMKSESVSVNSEESTSSPDSGYGNTPEYPNANAASSGEAKSIEGPPSSQENGVRDLHQESKLRASSDVDNECGFNGGAGYQSQNHSKSNGGDNGPLTPSQQAAGRKGEDIQLTRPSTGSSSSAVVSDCSSNEQRSRGGTNESLFSVESIISSPPVQNSEGGATSSRMGEGGSRDTQQVVVEKQQTKICLGRHSSLPPSVSGSVKSSTTPRSHHSNSAGLFPFHMSSSSGSLNHATRSPYWFGPSSSTTMTSPSGFSELHPSHPSYPSQPHIAFGGGGGVTSSQSYHNIHKVKHSPESSRKKRFRSGSLAFNRNAGTVIA